ncbi:MAG: hypothetical protein DCF30_17720 [Hyphomicrobiales bacterium]|nr:MAG: hypothetical protein DCF30_17720 [Hyphomicrobiales bacterium]
MPIACLTALAALTTYRTVIAAIEVSQARAADNFAVRTRVWYRGALRSLLASGAVMARTGGGGTDCAVTGSALLDQVQGYRAFQLLTAEGQACAASLDPGLTTADMAAISARMKGLPPVKVWGGGAELAQVRYDYVTLAERNYLAIYARNADATKILQEALLLVDPSLLDQVFDLGEAGEGMNVALLSSGGTVVTSRNSATSGTEDWLPRHEVVPQGQMRWKAPSRTGTVRTYAARLVAEPNLYVIASFDDAPARAARVQFLVLLFAPLLTLLLLCIVYLRAIDKHCIHWLRGIEGAARARSTEPNARAAIAADMPADIRSVAEAFNTMVDEQEVRQRRLQTALDDNRFLVRELHHRVKNSLQVVQSYIGLTKRDYRDEARLALADAECRVHVLSAAYRFTLADGEMQPVRVDLFIEDVVTMIDNLVRRRDQWVSSRLDTEATLSVDRIIPLGFLVVDVASRVLRTTPGVTLTIVVRDVDASTIAITLEADRDIAPSEPPKLFAGLVAQIEAVQAARPEGRSLGSWHVKHKA